MTVLDLGPGAVVLAQEGRQRAQEPAEVAATYLAGDPQRLNDAVADWIRQPLLRRVQCVVEAAIGSVVLREGGEGRLQRPRSPH